jgi:hypothetical protein
MLNLRILKLSLLPFILSASSIYAQTQNLEKAPEPPRVQPGETTDVKRQSGIGSDTAFSAAGVVEIGGSFGLTSASEFTEANFSPMIGYFFADNVQISALGLVNYVKYEEEKEKTIGSLLLEPSFHMPFTSSTFGFFGVGVGALFEQGEKTGFAVAPRIGYKNLVGRSGMLTVSFQPIFGLNESEVQTAQGTVLTVKQANNIRVGYTVLL